MSNNGGSSQASDIITYIGVPLAVLGVLPIIYNTFATLVALSRIKRMLRLGRLAALTRSDVVNRVIEIELPRYAVTPWDRFHHRAEYWAVSPHPSALPGGSWTTFNWRAHPIGYKTQRVEYADQVRLPQAEAAFDELVCYLLDLGAVPDPRGWRLLRSTGLWAPVGSPLMLAPDGVEKALTIAPSDDSDGHLSLAVTWSSAWTSRDYAHLPPYWVRLPPPPPDDTGADPQAEGGGDAKSGGEGGTQESSVERGSLDSLDRAGLAGRAQTARAITCHISVEGIVTAFVENAVPTHAAPVPESLDIEHLRVRPGRSDGVWFASAATAYGTTGQTMLWNYKIPDDILAFARKDTVPCGVLVLLGVVDDSETPEWATKFDDHGADFDLWRRRHAARDAAEQIEAGLPPEERERVAHIRIQRERSEETYDTLERLRRDAQQEETRMAEALQSPRWDARRVAERQLRWLQGRGRAAAAHGPKEAAGALLHRAVLDAGLAAALCRALDAWRAWAEVGGMRRADYEAVAADPETFALATLLVALIREASTGAAEGSTLALDLQECLRLWRKVRLG